jgi:hypothetical protein
MKRFFNHNTFKLMDFNWATEESEDANLFYPSLNLHYSRHDKTDINNPIGGIS